LWCKAGGFSEQAYCSRRFTRLGAHGDECYIWRTQDGRDLENISRMATSISVPRQARS
jgi:hypothetical protein